ncbi:MAG TPA: hypothetical protein DEQ30_14675 [Porphyromonadaceae bacterium]|nr:hypothetical protein [Porphyromonadaceae bacterium]
MEEFQQVLGAKCSFNGHVWDVNGHLFHVQSKKQPMVLSHPGYPNQGSRGYMNRDQFYSQQETMTITLQEIGSDDVVYDENGNFVCKKPSSNKKQKGQIYIWRQTGKFVYKEPNNVVDEYIPIQDMVLDAKVYSKIFTHIVSLEFKNDLSIILKSNISIIVYKYLDGKKSVISRYNTPKGHVASNANAAYNDNNQYYNGLKTVTAYVYTGDLAKNNKELYSTIWNVINLLGAHELVGHGVLFWFKDDYSSHHLTYLYQMGHSSFEHTTEDFKRQMKNRYNDYIKKFHPEDGSYIKTDKAENSKILRDHGLYPKDGELSKFTRRMLSEVQDTAKMKRKVHDLGLIDRIGWLNKRR